jgi:phenylalanyl-tRNA synthetase alpha subunit
MTDAEFKSHMRFQWLEIIGCGMLLVACIVAMVMLF